MLLLSLLFIISYFYYLLFFIIYYYQYLLLLIIIELKAYSGLFLLRKGPCNGMQKSCKISRIWILKGKEYDFKKFPIFNNEYKKVSKYANDKVDQSDRVNCRRSQLIFCAQNKKAKKVS